MPSRHTPPRLSLLLLAMLAPFQVSHAQQSTDTTVQQGGTLQFIGDNARLGIGYQNRGGLTGEFSGVLSEAEKSAWLGEFWLASQIGGGQISYHFLNNDAVIKSFFALDQNIQHDRKFTFGIGRENESWFGHVYASYSPSSQRLLNSSVITSTNEIHGNDSGRDYIDTISISTQTNLYERAYNYGTGVRAGHYYSDSQIRLTAGMDYEWGKSNAKQVGVSLNAEKFFAGTPHSVALQLSHYRKSGDFEDRLNDSRIGIFYRYNFGQSNTRHQEKYRIVEEKNINTTTKIVPATSEHTLVKTTSSMSGDAFFLFDSATLTDTAKTELANIAETLKKYKHIGNVKISGHTCDLGSQAYNQKLSLQRAIAVRDYLISLNALKADEVIAEGKGKSEPKFQPIKENRAKNRRVDLEFVSEIEKDKVVEIPAHEITVSEPVITFKREDIPQEPAWVRSALRNNMEHKRSVDTYRTQEKTQTQTKTRNYLNRPPVATNDNASTKQNQPVLIDVLSNDSDPDGNAISISALTSAAHGTVVIQGQKVLYTPATDYVGVDNFSYTIIDNAGGQSTASVGITVTPLVTPPQNHPPVANDDSITTLQNHPVVIDVLANDSDPDGHTLTINSVGSAFHGVTTIQGNKILYSPYKDYYGNDSFSYTIDDGHNGRATAQVVVSIQALPQNHPPVAIDDTFFVSGTKETVLDVLANDSDPDSDPLTIVSLTPTAGHSGILRIQNNKVIFTPFSYFNRDSFQYTITDGRGGYATATVNLIDP